VKKSRRHRSAPAATETPEAGDAGLKIRIPSSASSDSAHAAHPPRENVTAMPAAMTSAE